MSDNESQLSHQDWLFGNEFLNLEATRDAAATNIFVAVNIETRLIAADGESEPSTTVVSEIGLTFLGPLLDQQSPHHTNTTTSSSNHPRTLTELTWSLPMYTYCIQAMDVAPRSDAEPFLGTVLVVDRSEMETTMVSLLCEARRRLAPAPDAEPPSLTLVEFGGAAMSGSSSSSGPSLLHSGDFERAARHMDSWVDARALVGEVMQPRDVAGGLVGLGFAEEEGRRQRPDGERGAGNLALGTVGILAALLYYLPDQKPRGQENEGMLSSSYRWQRRLVGGAVMARTFPSLGGLRTLDAAAAAATAENVPRSRQRETALFHHFR